MARGIEEYPKSLVCLTLNISRSSYHKRIKEPRTKKEAEVENLAKEARRLFEENNSEYGRTRLGKAMREEGYNISDGTVRKLMKKESLIPRKAKKYKATTNSKHSYEVAENLLKREFKASRPNEKWCGDSTYISTEEGWLYVSAIIDLCDRSCVGLSFSSRHTQELMLETLRMGIKEHKPGRGTVFHSDRGVQYASNSFKEELRRNGMLQSMSKSGDPYDNAAMESFWSTVKTGCVYGRRFKTRKEARQTIFEYVYGFYNTRRYHSAIGYEKPLEYRRKLLASVPRPAS